MEATSELPAQVVGGCRLKSLFSRFQSAQLGLISSADGGDASNSLFPLSSA